jgi:ribosomal protein S21
VEIVPEIRRKKNESFEAFLRRAKKRWQQSGKVLQVKKKNFYEPKPNKSARKKSALHKLRTTQKMEYLKKIGKLPEETKGYKKR